MLSLLDMIGTNIFVVRWQHCFIDPKADITDCLPCLLFLSPDVCTLISVESRYDDTTNLPGFVDSFTTLCVEIFVFVKVIEGL